MGCGHVVLTAVVAATAMVTCVVMWSFSLVSVSGPGTIGTSGERTDNVAKVRTSSWAETWRQLSSRSGVASLAGNHDKAGHRRERIISVRAPLPAPRSAPCLVHVKRPSPVSLTGSAPRGGPRSTDSTRAATTPTTPPRALPRSFGHHDAKRERPHTAARVFIDVAYCNRCSFEREALTLRAAVERHVWLRLRSSEACALGNAANDTKDDPEFMVEVKITLTPRPLPTIASWVLSLSHVTQVAAGLVTLVGEAVVSMLGSRPNSVVADVVNSRTSLVAASLALSGFSARLVHTHGPLDITVNDRLAYSRPKRGGRPPILNDVVAVVDDALAHALANARMPSWDCSSSSPPLASLPGRK